MMYSLSKISVHISRTSVLRANAIFNRSKASATVGPLQNFANRLENETGTTRVGNNHLQRVVEKTRNVEDLEKLADLISIFRSRNKPIRRNVASQVVNLWVDKGEPTFAARMVRNKAKYGLYPDTATYSALLSALVGVGRNKAYISVFERMLLDNDDTVPSEEVMNTLVAAACAADCPAHRSKVCPLPPWLEQKLFTRFVPVFLHTMCCVITSLYLYLSFLFLVDHLLLLVQTHSFEFFTLYCRFTLRMSFCLAPRPHPRFGASFVQVSQYCAAATTDGFLGDAVLQQIAELATACVENGELSSAAHCLKCNMPEDSKRELELRVAVGKESVDEVVAVLQNYAAGPFSAELLAEVIAMPNQGTLAASISAAVTNICSAHGIPVPAVDASSEDAEAEEDDGDADAAGTDSSAEAAPPAADAAGDAPMTDADLFK
eukprot:m.490766 g.490766  ORF g.490766 m.490766 type:complete len:433 (+) comp21783_c0_seq5:164-1462(+)